MDIIIGFLIAVLVLLLAGRMVWRRWRGRKPSCDACTAGLHQSNYHLTAADGCGNCCPDATAAIPRWRTDRKPEIAIALTVLLIVLLGLAVFLVQRQRRRQTYVGLELEPRPTTELLSMQETAGRILGQYLKREYPDRHIVILQAPEAVRTVTDDLMLDALRNALPPTANLKIDEFALDDPTAPRVAGLWLSARAFDDALARHRQAEVVVSLAGLPEQVRRISFWRDPERPRLVLANAPVFLLRKLLAAEMIDAVLVRRPWQAGTPLNPAPENPDNWLLITSRNVDEIADAYKGVFSPTE